MTLLHKSVFIRKSNLIFCHFQIPYCKFVMIFQRIMMILIKHYFNYKLAKMVPDNTPLPSQKLEPPHQTPSILKVPQLYPSYFSQIKSNQPHMMNYQTKSNSYCCSSDQQPVLINDNYLRGSLQSKTKQLQLIKSSLNRELSKNYCYPENMTEIKRILIEFARKIQLLFCQGQLLSFQLEKQADSYQEIQYLIKVIEEHIEKAHQKYKDLDSATLPTIKRLYIHRQMLLQNNHKFIAYIDDLKQFSKKQKEKINKLEVNYNESRKLAEEEQKIIEEVAEYNEKLNLRYCSRNQLLRMIKKLNGKMKEYEQDGLKLSNHYIKRSRGQLNKRN